MDSSGLSMGDLPGFSSNDAASARPSSLGVVSESRPMANPPPDNYSTMLKNQEYMEASIVELTKMMTSMRSTQQAMLTTIGHLSTDIKDMRDANNNMHASNIDSGAFEVELQGNAQNTRGMSTSVPAALIRGAWYDVHPDEPFPVPFKYMKSICDAAMGEFPTGVKSSMGGVLSKCIRDIDSYPMIC